MLDLIASNRERKVSMLNPDLVNVAEVASYSNLSTRHIRLLLEKGIIQGQKIGRDWVTTKEEIDKYLATNPKRGRKPKKH